MNLINTQKYCFLSNSPLTILNKTSPCGASRDIGYFPVALPYNGKFSGDEIHKNSTIDDNTYKFGVIEVPFHSEKDPNKLVADQSHHLYVEKNKKNIGSFDNDHTNINSYLLDWNNCNGWSSKIVTEGKFLKGYDNKGNDILENVEIKDYFQVDNHSELGSEYIY